MAKVKIKNRSWGTTFYTIPELGDRTNVTRIFGPGEVKEIDEAELEALTYVPGGLEVLRNHLQIMDSELADQIIYNKEPEYDMSEEDIKDLMLNGSYDAFLDCLDFAPEGVLDLIKGYAISLPLNDSAKREAIRNKLHYDVDAILMRKRDEEDTAEEEKEPVRRVQSSSPARRTTPKYNVVKKDI